MGEVRGAGLRENVSHKGDELRRTKVVLDLANRRPAEARAVYEKAILTDPDSTRVVYPLVNEPK